MKLGVIAAEATVHARDVENMPGNLANPTYLAKQAQRLNGAKVKVKVLEKKDMERLKMGALLGVARGSVEAPKLVLLDYHRPARSARSAWSARA